MSGPTGTARSFTPLAPLPGGDRCPVGKAWQPSPKCRSKRPTPTPDAELFLCHDNFRGAGHPVGDITRKGPLCFCHGYGRYREFTRPIILANRIDAVIRTEDPEACPPRGVREQVLEQTPLALVEKKAPAGLSAGAFSSSVCQLRLAEADAAAAACSR